MMRTVGSGCFFLAQPEVKENFVACTIIIIGVHPLLADSGGFPRKSLGSYQTVVNYVVKNFKIRENEKVIVIFVVCTSCHETLTSGFIYTYIHMFRFRFLKAPVAYMVFFLFFFILTQVSEFTSLPKKKDYAKEFR